MKNLVLVLKVVITRVGIDVLFGNTSKEGLVHTLHSFQFLSTELRKKQVFKSSNKKGTNLSFFISRGHRKELR